LSGGAVPGPRAVLLDAMGTLLRLEAPAPALRRGLRDEHGIAVSAQAAEHAVAAEMAFYRAHHDEGSDSASLLALRLRCAEVLRDALGPVAGSLTSQALLPTLMRALRFSAFPDALPALDALRRAGARLAVVSNWDASLPEVLQRTGLAGRLDAVVASAVVGAAKPSPAIFVAALRAVGVPASAALHVGDTVDQDVLGARAAGIAAALLRRGPAAPEGVTDLPPGVPVIRSLAEVAGLAP
jgi:putative hydrolase of the HAD superfamily